MHCFLLIILGMSERLEMIYEIQEKMCQTFLYYTHIVPRLQCLFQRWCLLDNKEKLYMDYEILNAIELKGRILYKSLRDSFIKWDTIQDKEGACGFYPAALEYKYNLDVEEEITSVLNVFEVILHKLDNKNDDTESMQSRKFNVTLSKKSLSDNDL